MGNRRITAILICSMFVLNVILVSEFMKPVQGNRRMLLKLKSIGALLFLLKHKKPKIGFLPIPIPIPMQMKLKEKNLPAISVHKPQAWAPESFAEPAHFADDGWGAASAPELDFEHGGFEDAHHDAGHHDVGHHGGHHGGY